MRWVTVQQAARLLEVGERTVKRWVLEGKIERLGRAEGLPGRPLKLKADDVDAMGRRQQSGQYGRDVRTVVVVDPARQMEDIVTALRVSGLEVRTGETILSAISMSPIHVEPAIIVLETPRGPNLNLLHALRRRVRLVVIGPIPVIATEGDFTFDGTYQRADYDDLRQIVRHVWAFVDKRAESAQGSK